MVPATIEWVFEKAGLQLYSAGITPARGGPLLHLGANYPHTREDLEPLDEADSSEMQRWVVAKLAKSGYKAKMAPFSYEGDVDYNDFRVKVLLKEEDVDQEKYSALKRIRKERLDSRRV